MYRLLTLLTLIKELSDEALKIIKSVNKGLYNLQINYFISIL